MSVTRKIKNFSYIARSLTKSFSQPGEALGNRGFVVFVSFAMNTRKTTEIFRLTS